MTRRRAVVGSSGYTILVVDDQEETLVSSQLLLEREGHHLLTALSGEEALILFRPGHVHLVIVDYFMPGMSGEETVQAIRALDSDVQIILQTGYSGEKPPRDMLRQLDIQGYHDKTDGPDRLLLWVDVALKAATQLKQVRDIEREVAASRAQLQLLSARLLRLQEEERERISRELHDHLGQLLTAIGMDTEWVLRHCPEELAAVRERLRETVRLTQEATQTTRELSATLRPGELRSLGLEASLAGYTKEFARRSGVFVHYSSTLADCIIPSEMATNIYRVAQEALTNVARHAAATRITVELRQAGQTVILLVVDNGKGFAADRVSDPHAVGLVGMRERARLIGGELEVHSAPGSGTRVTLEVPLKEERPRDDYDTAG